MFCTSNVRYYSSSRWLVLLVTSLQVSGTFVYSWPRSKTPCRPAFSLPLCLWAVGLKVWMLGTMCLQLRIDTFNYVLDTVGGVVFVSGVTFATLVCTLSPFVLPLKSKQLAAILHDLDHQFGSKDAKTMPKERTLCQLLFFAVHLACFLASIYRYYLDNFGVTTSLLLSTFITAMVFGVSAPLMVFEILCGYLSHELYCQTTVMAEEVRVELLGPGTTPPAPWPYIKTIHKHGSDARLRLLHLEKNIYAVEQLMGQIVEYFPQIPSALLVCTTFTIIIGIFFLVRDTHLGIDVLPFTIFSGVVIYHLCSVGQAFSDKVKQALRILRYLSILTSDEGWKTSIQRVGVYMEAVGTLEVKGWYTLNHNTLISVLTFTATYLVILLQVGWQKMDATHS